SGSSDALRRALAAPRLAGRRAPAHARGAVRRPDGNARHRAAARPVAQRPHGLEPGVRTRRTGRLAPLQRARHRAEPVRVAHAALLPLPFSPALSMVARALAVARDLCAFIDAAPTPFHACAEVARRLERAGFRRLSEREPWPRAAGRHYVVRGGSLAAWAAP